MENSIYRVNFAESSLPVFKENKAKGYITFGEKNDYPNKLIDLYNKSPKHGAIVTQKASYLAGDKTEVIAINTEDKAKAEQNMNSINAYESFDDVKAKICQDAELFNGFALEVIWNKAKTSIAELYHLPFQNVRCAIGGGYMYSDDWSDRRSEIKEYPSFNPTTRENKQVYYFKFYRAGQEEYPLPEYVSALKYIEIDTEIANFHLNSIKSGFSAQTLIQLFKGQPTPDEARKTIKRFKDNFTGTDNAGSVIIQFNDPNETPSQINNLTPSDFDKLFLQLNQSVQQEIFSGHRVTSPMLFGIKTEGQLGGRSELIESYEAFQTSYVEPRQTQIDRALTSVFKYIAPVVLKSVNNPVIGMDYADLYVKGLMSLDEARQELGFAKQKDTKTVVDAINNLSPLVANKVIEQMTINEIRGIAGLPPIIGGDKPSNTIPTTMSAQNPFNWNDDKDIAVFNQFGEDASNFEEVPFKFGVALDLMILQYLGQNGLISVADVVNFIKQDAEVIQTAVDDLISRGLVESVNGQIQNTPDGLRELSNSNLGTEIVVRYKYGKSAGISGGDIIPTSRDFCKRIIGFNKLYTREEIDQMTNILGYDVWRRRGGWMTVKNSDPALHVPYCRHSWIAQTVRRKING
jgi:hypothetical protein